MRNFLNTVLALWSGIFLSCLLSGCSGGGGSVPPPPPIVIRHRKPSVFQAWNGITNLPGLTEDQKLAKHDLAILEPDYIGFSWNRSYRTETLTVILPTRYNLPVVRALNPNIKILIAVNHFDIYDNYLPINDPWWFKVNGQRVIAWAEGGTYRLNQFDPTLQDHVANRAKALIATGVIDGIFLDWFAPETAALQDIAKKVRGTIGNALLVVNANAVKLSPGLLTNVNGVFMENATINDLKTLQYNEHSVRQPAHNCFEGKRISPDPANPADIATMTAMVTSVTQQSGAHVLYAHPNPWAEPDHLHEWYPIYDQII